MIETIPVNIDTENKEFNDKLNTIREIESIGTIATQLNDLNGALADVQMPLKHLRILQKMFHEQLQGGQIVKGVQRCARAHTADVVEQTKQVLINTLMELDKQFPNLDNAYNPSADEVEKVQNIITNKIYGNNNPMNIATGVSVVQKDVNTNFNVNYQQLSNLGVDDQYLEELKEIIALKDKPTIRQRLLKWTSAVSVSLTAKGLTDNLPLLIEHIQGIF